MPWLRLLENTIRFRHPSRGAAIIFLIAAHLLSGCEAEIKTSNSAETSNTSTEWTSPTPKVLDISQMFETGYYTDYDVSSLPLTSVCSNNSLFGISGAAVCQQGVAVFPAIAADVVSGREFWDSSGNKITGTMAASADVNGANGALSFLIPQGYYDGTTSCTASDSDLIAGNIANGVTLFGVTGNANLETHLACISANQTGCVSSATFPTQSTPATPAAAGDVLSGKQYYAGGAMQTGTMTDRGALDASLSFPGAGYYNGTVVNLPDPSQIVAGQTVLGVAGTAVLSDTTPNAFTFTDETNVPLSTAKVSNAVTITGINSLAAITVTGDAGFGYKLNGGPCTSMDGSVAANDTVAACVTSSASNSTATSATVTIGGVSDTYSVTTSGGLAYVPAGSGTAYDANASSVAITGLTLTDGHLVTVLVTHQDDATVTSVTDSNGNTWVRDAYANAAASVWDAELWRTIVEPGKGGSGVSITVNKSNSPSGWNWITATATSYSSPTGWAASPLDKVYTQAFGVYQGGSSVTFGTAEVAQASELILVHYGPGNGGPSEAPAGYQESYFIGADQGLYYRAISSVETPSITISNPSGDGYQWEAIMVTYKTN